MNSLRKSTASPNPAPSDTDPLAAALAKRALLQSLFPDCADPFTLRQITAAIDAAVHPKPGAPGHFLAFSTAAHSLANPDAGPLSSPAPFQAHFFNLANAPFDPLFLRHDLQSILKPMASASVIFLAFKGLRSAITFPNLPFTQARQIAYHNALAWLDATVQYFTPPSTQRHILHLP